jgi:hypothetical protein
MSSHTLIICNVVTLYVPVTVRRFMSLQLAEACGETELR